MCTVRQTEAAESIKPHKPSEGMILELLASINSCQNYPDTIGSEFSRWTKERGIKRSEFRGWLTRTAKITAPYINHCMLRDSLAKIAKRVLFIDIDRVLGSMQRLDSENTPLGKHHAVSVFLARYSESRVEISRSLAKQLKFLAKPGTDDFWRSQILDVSEALLGNRLPHDDVRTFLRNLSFGNYRHSLMSATGMTYIPGLEEVQYGNDSTNDYVSRKIWKLAATTDQSAMDASNLTLNFGLPIALASRGIFAHPATLPSLSSHYNQFADYWQYNVECELSQNCRGSKMIASPRNVIRGKEYYVPEFSALAVSGLFGEFRAALRHKVFPCVPMCLPAADPDSPQMIKSQCARYKLAKESLEAIISIKAAYPASYEPDYRFSWENALLWYAFIMFDHQDFYGIPNICAFLIRHSKSRGTLLCSRILLLQYLARCTLNFDAFMNLYGEIKSFFCASAEAGYRNMDAFELMVDWILIYFRRKILISQTIILNADEEVVIQLLKVVENNVFDSQKIFPESEAGPHWCVLVSMRMRVIVYDTLMKVCSGNRLSAKSVYHEYLSKCLRAISIPQRVYGEILLQYCRMLAADYPGVVELDEAIGKRMNLFQQAESLAAMTWQSMLLISESAGPLDKKAVEALILCGKILRLDGLQGIREISRYLNDYHSHKRAILDKNNFGDRSATESLANIYPKLLNLWWNPKRKQIFERASHCYEQAFFRIVAKLKLCNYSECLLYQNSNMEIVSVNIPGARQDSEKKLSELLVEVTTQFLVSMILGLSSADEKVRLYSSNF